MDQGVTSTFKSSVQFSHWVVSDSLWRHELQHARPPCPSPTPGAYSNSCPSRRWCHPTTSSPIVPFSSRLQSFPASGSFPMSQFFALVAKVFELQLQHQSFQWIFRTDSLKDSLVWSPCRPKDFQDSSPASQFKRIYSSAPSFLYDPIITLIHDYWKMIALTIWNFVSKVMSCLFYRVVSSGYLKLLIFLPAILIPACDLFSLAFRMMYSAEKLNKQGDNIQPWCIPFPIWNQSVVPCPVPTIASCLHTDFSGDRLGGLLFPSL